MCNCGQPLRLTDLLAPPAPRLPNDFLNKHEHNLRRAYTIPPGCCNTVTAKKGGFTQPVFTGMGSAQEKRPTCLKTHGSLHRGKGAGEEDHLYLALSLPGWRLEGPSSTLWWPELSQTAGSYWKERVGFCRAFVITGISHSKLWQSPGGFWGHGKMMGEEKKERHCEAPRRWAKGLCLNAETVT